MTFIARCSIAIHVININVGFAPSDQSDLRSPQWSLMLIEGDQRDDFMMKFWGSQGSGDLWGWFDPDFIVFVELEEIHKIWMHDNWTCCWTFTPLNQFLWLLLFCPGFIQACRALMIVCLILGLFGMIVSILGLRCITIRSSSDKAKSKMAATGGILFILAGEILSLLFL